MNKMETKDPILLLGAVTDRRLAALRVILAVGRPPDHLPDTVGPGRYMAVA